MYPMEASTVFDTVCAVLDGVANQVDRVNWRRPMYTVIDDLHASMATQDQIDTAEQISIALLKLDWALLEEDSDKEESTREQLSMLAKEWRSLAEATAVNVEEVLRAQEVGSVTAALERINLRHQWPSGFINS